MGGKNKAPPPPDYSAIAAASERSAELAFEIGQEQLDWAREQYANDAFLIANVLDSALTRQDINDEAALRDRERYERIYQPLEDELARESMEYNSPQRERFEMERAQATIAQNFEAQRRAAVQNLESYGVDPSATRFAALDAGSRVAQAAAAAGAGNQARTQSEAIGRALRSEAINVGRGYPGQVAGTYGTALQSGNQATNSALATTASGASTMGTGTQWAGLGNQALGTWGNTLNMGYQNQLSAHQANQSSSSGIGGLLGAGLGAIGNAGGMAAFFEGGGAVPDPSLTPGGNVPMQASPTRGAAIDDVSAKLTAGEFVVPKDVVQWKGEEFFQKVIEGSRKSKPEAPAQPTYALAPPEAPTFQSSPQQPQGAPGGAIPMR